MEIWKLSQIYRRPTTDPVLAHIHVPKCGGTAFRKFLTQHRGTAHLALYVPDTFYVYPESELAQILSDRTVLGFSSHFVRTFPRQLAGRDMLYVTFLRNPVDQFISYITYIKKNYRDIQNDTTLIESLPSEPISMSTREIARWLLTCDRHVNFRENYTVNFFSRYTVPGESGPFRFDSHFRRRRLPTSVQVLRRFFFVGASDQMERSVAVLRKLAQHLGLDLPQGEVPVENTSFEFRDDLTWIHPQDEVGSMLLASVREDRALYEFALRRLAILEQFAEQIPNLGRRNMNFALDRVR